MTKERSELVDYSGFICTRLSEDREHTTMFAGFSSWHNYGLAQYLKTKAWQEDENNYRAYYLVKDGRRIVLYFSLQCGMLVKCNRKALSGIVHQNEDDRTEYFLEGNKIDVTKSIPAIELAHFCVNDTYRRKKSVWKVCCGIDELTVGAYVFYKFIVPRVLEVMSIVGCQYLYLFCADDDSGKLAEYYQEVLHFEYMDQMACVRQGYDDGLECMTLKKEVLIQDYSRFLDMEKVDEVLEYISAKGSVSIKQVGCEFSLSDSKDLMHELQNFGKIRESSEASGYYVLATSE